MRVTVLLLISSIALGAGYYAYLTQVDFAQPLARLIPFAWLVIAGVGCWRSLELRFGAKSRLTVVIMFALNMVSALAAIPFAMAAVVGD